MKKIIILALIGFVFSCVDNSKKPKESYTQESIELKVDSLKISDSLKVNKMLSVSYDEDVLVFSNLNNKVLLDSIYHPIDISLDLYDKQSLERSIRLKKTKFFEESIQASKEWMPDFAQTWEENNSMKLFSHKDNLLTIIYSNSGYSGGAHGFYNVFYRVFDLKKNESIQLQDILKNPKDESWSQILLDNFNDKEQKQMLLVDKILPNSNFYFDKEKISFVYNQYEITAYAAGVVYITLDFNKIKDKLKPKFIKDFNIN